MKVGFWMENGMRPNSHVLVDCGPWSDSRTRDRFDRLREHLALRNFERVGNDRLVARIPPTKVATVLESIPEIAKGAAGYCWCTHGFKDEQVTP